MCLIEWQIYSNFIYFIVWFIFNLIGLGVDIWIYYVKNLFNNFNIAYILALISPVFSGLLTLIFESFWLSIRSLFQSNENHKLNRKHADNNYIHYLINTIVPFYIWYLFFTYMPHKEGMITVLYILIHIFHHPRGSVLHQIFIFSNHRTISLCYLSLYFIDCCIEYIRN